MKDSTGHMNYVNEKIAVITGAASGIGRALAQQLNAQGCHLYLSDINEAGLKETVDSLINSAARAESRVIDISDRAAVHQWAEHLGEDNGHVDIVINNAGVALMSPVVQSNYEDLEWMMGINFWGVIHGTMAFLPLLQRAKQGHLINISSVFGMIGVPTQSAYNAAKFAVRGYTEALRQEMEGSNVHVCCVHPGGIKTNIARHSRSVDPDSTADSRDSNFQTAAKTTPDSAAMQIIKAIQQRKKRLLIGNDAKFISIITRLFPVRYPRFMPWSNDLG